MIANQLNIKQIFKRNNMPTIIFEFTKLTRPFLCQQFAKQGRMKRNDRDSGTE